MFKNLFIKCILLGLLIIHSTIGVISGDEMTPTKKNILLLNSYNRGYIWSDNIVTAIEEEIKESNITANIDTEYMNAKLIFDDQYFDKLYVLYKYKYSKIKYDVIIASDDDAFMFLTKFRDELFPGTPVVFCGVNNEGADKLKEMQNYTGILEDTSLDSTIEMIRAVHTDARRIHIITDNTTLGKLIVNNVMKISAKNPSIAFTMENTEKIDDILNGLVKLDEHTIVLLAPSFVKDHKGNFLSIKETTKLVTDNTEAPVYAIADFYMGNGVVGSKVNNSSFQGETAAKIALEILNGKSIETLPVVYYPNKQFVFDYNELKKLGIVRARLPKGSVIINKPVISYNFSSEELWMQFFIFLCILVSINIILLINIKKRRRAEGRLRRSEGILRATLNATANGIVVISLDKKIIDCNQPFLTMWGFPPEIIEKKNLTAMFKYCLKQVNEPGTHYEWVKMCFEQTQPISDIIYLKDDRVYEVYSEILIIQGKLQGRVWSFKDITAYKQVKNELKKSEERYRRLVELSPDAIYMLTDGKVIFTNEAGKELIRAPHDMDINGSFALDFIDDEYSERVKNCLLGENRGIVDFPLMEMRLKRMDNTFVDVEAATTQFTYNRKKAILTFVRDISERKETEALKRSIMEKTKQLNDALEYDKLKTEFFANISHELRTPINVILGTQKLFGLFLQEVELGNKQEKLNKYINMLRQNCYRLMRLVNNLIDITRIDAGFFNIDLRNYDIINIVECITLSVVEYVEEKGIELIFDTQLEEKTIACDADKIERIMLNLLSNAIKFTNRGGIIKVYITESSENIIISVSDSGIGIPEEKLNAVFERFVQVDRSFIRNHEGSGIGLSIVKSLVDLHGGDIELISELGKGTTFEIRLPITLVEEEVAATSEVTYQSSGERINVEFSDIYFD